MGLEITSDTEINKGHGRIETRKIEVTSSLAEYLSSDWPSCNQVYRLTRVRKIGKKVETEVSYGITSLTRDRAAAGLLLGYTRKHWRIENNLHGVRDGAFREDASRIRKGSSPQTMAILRNIIIFMANRLGHKSMTSTMRYYVCRPMEAIGVMSMPI